MSHPNEKCGVIKLFRVILVVVISNSIQKTTKGIVMRKRISEFLVIFCKTR